MELAIQRIGERERIYLDANATTPPSKRALDAMYETARNYWGNPSSGYEEGVSAKARLDGARAIFAGLMDVDPDTILFTSCGTESNNIALRSVMCRAMRDGRDVLITSSVEHPSVKRTANTIGCTHVQLRVDRRGYVDMNGLKNALSTYGERVAMVEIGDIEPTQLGHSHAAPIEQLQHRIISQVAGRRGASCLVIGARMARRRPSGGGIEQLVELGVAEDPGQPRVRRRCGQPDRRVGRDQSATSAPTEVGTERRGRSGDGRLGVAPSGQEGEVAAEQDPVDAGRPGGPAALGPASKTLDVGGIGPHGLG